MKKPCTIPQCCTLAQECLVELSQSPVNLKCLAKDELAFTNPHTPTGNACHGKAIRSHQRKSSRNVGTWHILCTVKLCCSHEAANKDKWAVLMGKHWQQWLLAPTIVVRCGCDGDESTSVSFAENRGVSEAFATEKGFLKMHTVGPLISEKREKTQPWHKRIFQHDNILYRCCTTEKWCTSDHWVVPTRGF